MKPKVLCIATKCKDVAEFIAKFHTFVDDTSLFIATTSIRDVGSESPIAVTLVDRTPVLRGWCTVLEIYRDANNVFGRPGFRVGLERLTQPSEDVFAQLRAARAQAKPAARLTQQLHVIATTAPTPTPTLLGLPIIRPPHRQDSPAVSTGELPTLDAAPRAIADDPFVAPEHAVKKPAIAVPATIKPVAKPVRPTLRAGTDVKGSGAPAPAIPEPVTVAPRHRAPEAAVQVTPASAPRADETTRGIALHVRMPAAADAPVSAPQLPGIAPSAAKSERSDETLPRVSPRGPLPPTFIAQVAASRTASRTDVKRASVAIPVIADPRAASPAPSSSSSSASPPSTRDESWELPGDATEPMAIPVFAGPATRDLGLARDAFAAEATSAVAQVAKQAARANAERMLATASAATAEPAVATPAKAARTAPVKPAAIMPAPIAAPPVVATPIAAPAPNAASPVVAATPVVAAPPVVATPIAAPAPKPAPMAASPVVAATPVVATPIAASAVVATPVVATPVVATPVVATPIAAPAPVVPAMPMPMAMVDEPPQAAEPRVARRPVMFAEATPRPQPAPTPSTPDEYAHELPPAPAPAPSRTRSIRLADGSAPFARIDEVAVPLPIYGNGLDRTPGSDIILPANPFMDLTDASLEGIVECRLFEAPHFASREVEEPLRSRTTTARHAALAMPRTTTSPMPMLEALVARTATARLAASAAGAVAQQEVAVVVDTPHRPLRVTSEQAPVAAPLMAMELAIPRTITPVAVAAPVGVPAVAEMPEVAMQVASVNWPRVVLVALLTLVVGFSASYALATWLKAPAAATHAR